MLAKVPSGAEILIIGVNDDITNAMNQAVKQAGRVSQSLVMSIGGAQPTGLQYVCKNSNYVGVVGFFPENWPASLVPALLGVINNAKVPVYPDKVIIQTEVITPSTISKFYPSFTC